jgi:CheY-like chemotaxis protein
MVARRRFAVVEATTHFACRPAGTTDSGQQQCAGRAKTAAWQGSMALHTLIVDDFEPFLQAARDLLEREGMVVVGVATSGAGALRIVEERRPDLLLVDIDLGDESGFDLARAIARRPDSGRLPVILISASAEEDVADLVEACPAVGFLSKSTLSSAAIEAMLGHE